MGEKYIKDCPNCGELQTYTTKGRLECSIREKWVCNKCSSTHQKKIYSEEIIDNVVELYMSGVSFSKISTLLKVRRDNVKSILKEKNVWVESRDNLKKDFSNCDVDDIVRTYENGMSLQKIGEIYNVSKTVIRKIVKDNGVLREGYSDGIKIDLTEEQKEKIKDLYLNEYKTCVEISEKLGLTSSFIDKYLGKCGFRRNISESLSISRKGLKRTEEVKLRLSIAQKKYAMSGKRKQTGGYCKIYDINGLKCQGTYERYYIEKLIKDNIQLPENTNSIITPFGVYYPDFSYKDRLIEIKSDYTYDILIGEKMCRFTKKTNTNQLNKIKWVNDNIMTVDLLIVDKRNNKIIKKDII
jgi:transposase-like protein